MRAQSPANESPASDRRDSFVSEDLNDLEEINENQREVASEEQRLDLGKGPESSPKPSDSDLAEGHFEDRQSEKDVMTSPKSVSGGTFNPPHCLSANAESTGNGEEGGHASRQHGSSSQSASSSVLATPHQQTTSRFGSLDVQDMKRDSVDSGNGFREPILKSDIPTDFVIKQRSPTNDIVGRIGFNDVCPLENDTAASYSDASTQRRQEPKKTTSFTDAVPTSPGQKGKLSLLPSAFGFAAGLLPNVRAVSTPTVATASTEKSPTTSESDERDPAGLARHDPERQTSTSSETSSIISSTSSSSRARSDNATGSAVPGASPWKSLTSFLSRSAVPTQDPTTPTPGKLQRGAAQQAHISEMDTPSTSFLLHHITSPSATADRRRSTELGGPQRLREGFERVKAEMVSAAKELREKDEEKKKRDSGVAEDSSELATSIEGHQVDDPTEGGGEQMSMDTLENSFVGVDGIDWQFWGAVMNDYEEVAQTRPKDLSRAIQQGIPAVVRGTIWQLMSSSKSVTLEATYSALLKLSSPHEKAIQKDLARTFPQYAYFKANGGGQENLFNVVKAYSLYDQDVGYTQGLAFIVAAILLNMPEEEAFCVLVRLMHSYGLRSHFLPDMPGLQLRMYQFDRLLEELLPALHLHFVRAGVKSSMYASQWFMTMFSYRFPLCLVYRIFDIVFAEGIEAIFRFSMALMRKNEERLLELDFEGVLKFLTEGIFECYKNTEPQDESTADSTADSHWLTNEFVCDAYAVQITPFMLDSFAGEWEGQLRVQNAHAIEIDTLRNANRNLSNQLKQLEIAVAAMNTEHVEMVRELVQSRIEREEMESELIRYKLMCADLSHEQQKSRMSSVTSLQSR